MEDKKKEFIVTKLLERILGLKNRLDKLVFLYIAVFLFAMIKYKADSDNFIRIEMIGLQTDSIIFYHLVIAITITILFAIIGSHLIEYAIKRSELNTRLSNDFYNDYMISKTIIPTSFYEFMYSLYCYQDPLRKGSTFILFGCFFLGHTIACFHLSQISEDTMFVVFIIFIFITIHVALYNEFANSWERANSLLGKIIKDKIYFYTLKFFVISLILLVFLREYEPILMILEQMKVKSFISEYHSIIVFFLILLFLLFHILSSNTIRNVIKFFPATNKDYLKFNYKTLNKSSTPFKFREKTNATIANISFKDNNLKEVQLNKFLTDTKTEAFVIIKENTIIYEFFAKEYNRKTPLMMWSITKVFISTIFGILLKNKQGPNLEDKNVIEFIPELKGRIKKNIKIKNLLNMDSGINFPKSRVNKFISKYNFLPYLEVHYGNYLLLYILQKAKSKYPPGEKFRYSQIDSILLVFVIRSILDKNRNKSIVSYLQDEIWDKLGMENNAFFTVDETPNEVERGASGLFASVIDIAKLGKLYLDGGEVKGERVLNKAWVDECLGSQNRSSGMSNFWRHTSKTQDSIKFNDTYAIGANGNELLYLIPDEKIIIVRSGKGMFKKGIKDNIRRFCNQLVSRKI